MGIVWLTLKNHSDKVTRANNKYNGGVILWID